jgi:hypothetical protein
MKQFVSFGAIAMAAIVAGGLTSCQEEDFGLDSSVVKKTEYARGFANEFGKPDANQRWDFYAMEMEQRAAAATGVTRATAATTYTVTKNTVNQPSFIAEQKIDELCDETYLPDEKNNSTKGTRDYTLSYGGKAFTVSAILYAGYYETQSGFEFGIAQNVSVNYWTGRVSANRTKIFGYGDTGNPGYAKEVALEGAPAGTSFDFYIKANDHYYYSSLSHSMLLGEDEVTTQKVNSAGDIVETTYYYRMIGFEDAWAGTPDMDFNDIVVVISTTEKNVLPAPKTARYFCEDLYQLDWDFNDVVFDVSNTGVTLLAVGGTLPVYLSFDGGVTKTDELHGLMGGGMIDETYYQPINVGASNGVDGLTSVKIEIFDEVLTDEEVAAFKPILYVGDEQFTLVNKDANAVVEFNPSADIPSIIQVPSDTKWMKEVTNISLGYPTFYVGQDGKKWYEANVQSQYLY